MIAMLWSRLFKNIRKNTAQFVLNIKNSRSAAFEDLLVNEIAEGEGLGYFYLHNTWLPRHIKKIVPLQSETLIPEKFTEIFANVSKQDFVQPDPKDGAQKIYALPLYVDTLALYYNKRF